VSNLKAARQPKPLQDKFSLSKNIVKLTRNTCAIQIKAIPLHTVNLWFF
jgi:hypothetical protein